MRFFVAAALIALLAPQADALERLCDSSFEDCRNEVLERIRAEQVEVNVAAWFFEDARFSHELIERWRAGVPVRVIGDPRADAQHPGNGPILAAMADAEQLVGQALPDLSNRSGLERGTVVRILELPLAIREPL